jgi:hypothetical protein
VISSGTNGYSANAGYNLVTGLGTPVAGSLVPDLVAYAGPGTSYPGPTVAPLQSTTLSTTWTGGGSGVFNVFDALGVVGGDPDAAANGPLAEAPGVGASSDRVPTAIQSPARSAQPADPLAMHDAALASWSALEAASSVAAVPRASNATRPVVPITKVPVPGRARTAALQERRAVRRVVGQEFQSDDAGTPHRWTIGGDEA